MSNKPTEDGPVYLKQKNGWFWVMHIGQRAIYHGPYRTQADAEKYRTDVDAPHTEAHVARLARMRAMGFRSTGKKR